MTIEILERNINELDEEITALSTVKSILASFVGELAIALAALLVVGATTAHLLCLPFKEICPFSIKMTTLSFLC